jgi:hypothetical protein
MQRYWILTERHMSLGMGVTARSPGDAISLLREVWPTDRIVDIRAIADIAELDQRHVVPNMGNWLQRGIWFPLGYEHISN